MSMNGGYYLPSPGALDAGGNDLAVIMTMVDEMIALAFPDEPPCCLP